MSDNKYWHSFSELTDNERLQKLTKDEFGEELPFGDFDDKGLLDAKTPRRDFLKYLGFSTAAATLAASCKQPVRRAIPYVNKPENIIPGVAKYYATTFVQDGEVVPVLAKVRDGRPIKIEGNSLSSLTKGGTSARVQASVLDLYDTHRLTHPKRNKGNGTFDEIPTFEQVDTQIANALANLGSGSVVLLTSTIVSPSTRQLITEFLGKYPGSRHVQYDAISYSGLLQANGGRIPAYQFDKAKVIVSLGADFLGTWLNPVENAKNYAVGRKINEAAPTMSKHYQFESYLSLTGSNADERYTHRPSETGAVALALLAAVGGAATAPSIADAKLTKGIQKAAADLKAAGGAGVVVSGSNDPNVQAVVAAINAAIGANGNTINTATTATFKQGIDADMAALVTAMEGGQVGALLICDANPVYDYFDAARFANAMKKVKLSVSFNTKLDETTKLCQYSIPTHHYLESWGDAEPKAGYVFFIQPTINPLFKTRPFQTSLLKWSGNNTDWETYFRNYWTGKLGGAHQFNVALQDGVLEGTTTTGAVAPAGGGASVSLAAATAALAAPKPRAKNELVLYQNVAMAAGKQGGNPWLLELPDPVTKVTWGNFAMVSVSKAKELGIELNTDYEYYQDKPLIDLTINNKKVTVPVMVVPGMQADTIAVAVGYGRNEEFGVASRNVGPNVYPFARFNGTTVDYYTDINVARAAGTEKVAQQQIHSSYEGRTQVVKETTLATFLKYPHRYTEEREELVKDFARKTGDYRKEGTLYGDHIQPGAKWGMSIDLNSCIGCGACVVACHLENNVPVVGKNEVLRAHEMHWLRIDRYFVSDEKNPDDLKAVVFQPMLCQHCDNAPCENVCPVAATTHSSEGINQMAYNRCIGTRYCANNCPYKVRRFNWGDYTGASTHGKLGPKSGTGELNEVVYDMNDELTRMVLNPDVVTRSRGVMEKCTFCVQRTQAGKLKAKQENRAIKGDEVQSACAQACPTNAIMFGNVNDKTSTVAQIRKNNPGRLFYVIEQIHTLPNVNYLARIRNTEEITFVENTVEGGEHARQQEKKGAVNSNETVNEHK
ncbi:MAG: [Fe-S]-binding protein [Chitinophagaceae bacterium]